MARMHVRSAILARRIGLLRLCPIARESFLHPITSIKGDFHSIYTLWTQRELIFKRSVGIMALTHFQCLARMERRSCSAAIETTAAQGIQIFLLRIGSNKDVRCGDVRSMKYQV